MGYFYYSKLARKPGPEELEENLKRINEKLWGTRYRVDKVEGVPVSRGDNRKAMWAFMLTDKRYANCDAAFSVSLLKGGQLEFKVPRSSWGQDWEDQQKVRRRLVRLYGSAGRGERPG